MNFSCTRLMSSNVISRGTSPPGAMGTPLGLRFCRPVKVLLEVAPPWWSWAKILAP